MQLLDIHKELENLFSFSAIVDAGVNGVQVENFGDLCTLAFAVDSTLQTIQWAIDSKANVLFVHHGLFWGQQEIITGVMYKKIQLLIQHNIALYAIHLPLDAHPVLGNNIQIANALNLVNSTQNILYKGTPLGYSGEISKQNLIVKLSEYFPFTFSSHHKNQILNLQKDKFNAGISSGACSQNLFYENAHKVDIFLTGEVNLAAYNLGQDMNIPIIPLGHYYTEVFGIFALMKFLEEKYPILNFKFIGDDKYI